VFTEAVPQTSSSTRDRLVDEAMRLFAENGFRGASVAQIEAAAGLTPGAGGLYHHFESKEQLLAAGIERHLERLERFREVRALMGPLGDLRVELAVTARYFLAELDSEAELFRILVSESRRRPELLTTAVNRLIASTFGAFGDWLSEKAEGQLDLQRARRLAQLALGSLLSSRLLRVVLAIEALDDDDDEASVEMWVDMVARQIEAAAETQRSSSL
jgi:AcrR family transcriptional regulator